MKELLYKWDFNSNLNSFESVVLGIVAGNAYHVTGPETNRECTLPESSASSWYDKRRARGWPETLAVSRIGDGLNHVTGIDWTSRQEMDWIYSSAASGPHRVHMPVLISNICSPQLNISMHCKTMDMWKVYPWCATLFTFQLPAGTQCTCRRQ